MIVLPSSHLKEKEAEKSTSFGFSQFPSALDMGFQSPFRPLEVGLKSLLRLITNSIKIIIQFPSKNTIIIDKTIVTGNKINIFLMLFIRNKQKHST